jgi:ribose 5-phosphate isomerase B
MKVYIGADHNGFRLRRSLIEQLKKAGYDVHDDGDQQLDPLDDYPVFAERVVKDVLGSEDKDAKGILICGSGQGMCIAANRHKGIRAALLHDSEAARSARNDDDCNIACLPARILEADKAFYILKTFLDTPFANAPRFARRIKEMDEIN